jgi:hypothetical protein
VVREALQQDIEGLVEGGKHGVGRADIDRVAERYFPGGEPRAKEFRDALANELEELIEEARQRP